MWLYSLLGSSCCCSFKHDIDPTNPQLLLTFCPCSKLSIGWVVCFLTYWVFFKSNWCSAFVCSFKMQFGAKYNKRCLGEVTWECLWKQYWLHCELEDTPFMMLLMIWLEFACLIWLKICLLCWWHSNDHENDTGEVEVNFQTCIFVSWPIELML